MKQDKIIVWGVGKMSKKFVDIIGTKEILYFADSNKSLHGRYFFDKKILSIQDILKLPEKYLIVISSEKYEDDIKKQLLENGLDNYVNTTQYRILNIFKRSRQNKRIILLNTHDNINVGDHTITIAEHYFFRKYMSEYDVFEIPMEFCTKEINYIYHFVNKDDLLIITGGGFLGNLWLEGGENNVRNIIQIFVENRIVIFPQTMYYEKNVEGERQKEISKEIYNKHKRLTICFRDEMALQLGQEIFVDRVRKIYVPDIVTLLDRSDEIYFRHGILMCIREDKERILSECFVRELIDKIEKRGYIVTQMSMLLNSCVPLAERMDVINTKLHQMQTSELVVTDRLHCMLLCAISGTPCLAFNNKTNKVYGVYQWIKENPYICLVNEKINIWETIDRLLSMPSMVYTKGKVEKKFEELAKFLKTEEM